MTEKLDDILLKFRTIRKRKLELKLAEIIVLLIFGMSFITVFITALFDTDLSGRLSQQLAMWGMITAVISLSVIFLFVNFEKVPRFIQGDLRQINNILLSNNIKTKEEREMLKNVVKNSMQSRKFHPVLLKTAGGLLITPVLGYVFEGALKQEWIIKMQAGVWTIGTKMAEYVDILLITFFIISVINIIKIMLDKDNSIKNDLLAAIDEIDLWLEISEQETSVD